jgi:hypothetical protein
MPGLLRGVARTAAVAGTATAVSNRVSRRQANRWAAKEQQAAPPQQQYAEPAPQQYAPPPQQYASPPQQYAPAPAVDPIEHLERLGQLKASGVLTAEEFATEKAKILSST